MATAPGRTAGAGLPRGVEVGPLGPRFLGYLIDHLPPAVVIGLASTLTAGGDGSMQLLITAGAIAVSLVWALVVGWMYATRAAGPGMRATKLQLVGLSDGRPIGYARFFVRWLVLSLLTATGIGLLLMVVVMARKSRRQGWHDLAANSVVIKERALPPSKAASASTPAVAAVTPTTTGATSASQAERREPVPVLQGSPAEAGGGGEAADPEVPEADSPTRVVPAVVEPAVVEPVPKLQQGWEASLDDGRLLQIESLVLLGRNPTPQPGEEHAQLIKVGDESRTVSKTHLALGVDANGMWVMDRGSTNGSTVTTVDGVSEPCAPGRLVEVAPESIVSFGDHWLRVHRD